MSVFDDILRGNDGKYSLKNTNAFMSFVAGVILCFVIVICKIYGKDVSIEAPTLLITSSLGLCGLSGWQNIAHYKVNAGITDPPSLGESTVNNNTVVNLDK